MALDVDIVVDSRQVERALKRLAPEVQKGSRREMRQLANRARDQIRGEVPIGPAEGGHAFRAVTSGTRGLNPTLKLNRSYRDYIGGMFFGAKGNRYPQFPRAKPGGYYFYPTIERIRPEAVKRHREILQRAVRRVGLD